MSLQLYINNIDITEYLAIDSLSITRNINETPSECTFELSEKTSYFGLYEFLVGIAKTDISYTASSSQQTTSNIVSLLNTYLPVEVKRNNTSLFRGFITNIDKTSKNGMTTYSITVLDPISLFKKTIVENKTYTNTTIGNIVKDLLSVMPNVSQDNTFINDNTVVDNWIIGMKSLDQILSELRSRSSAYFYLDEESRLHWVLQSSPEQSNIIFSEFVIPSSSPIVEGTFSVNENISNIVNKVTVVASQDSISDETLFSNNNATDGFRLSSTSTSWPPQSEASNNFSLDYMDLSVSVVGQTQTGSTPCDGTRQYYYIGETPPSLLSYTDSGPSCYYGKSNGIYYAFCVHIRVQVPNVPKSSLVSCVLNLPNSGYYDWPNDGVGSFYVQIIDESSFSFQYTNSSLGGFEVPIGATQVEIPVSYLPDSGDYLYFKIGVGPLNAVLQNDTYNYVSLNTGGISLQYTYLTGQNEYTMSRGYLTFDTSSIPTNATITEAKLKLYSLSSITNLPCQIEYTTTNEWNPTVEGIAVNNHLFSVGWNTLTLQNTQYIKKGSGSTIFRIRRDHNTAPTSSSSLILRTQESTFKPVLEVKYRIIVQGVRSTVSDSQSIALYGVRHLVVQKSEYTTVSECEQEAKRLLEQYKNPQLSIRFSSQNIPSPAIGSTVQCDFPSLNLANQFFLVARKSEKYNNAYVEYSYDLNQPSPDLIKLLTQNK